MEGVNKKLSLLGGDSVDIFKGIPFATAKTLENPQRHPGWQGGCWVLGLALAGVVLAVPLIYAPSLIVGTLKAKDFKKRCLQATITQDNTYGQEDCLYLNIWVPQSRKQGLDPSFPEDLTPPSPHSHLYPHPKLQTLPWSAFGATKPNIPKIRVEERRGCQLLIPG